MIQKLGREILLLTKGHLTGVLALVRSSDGRFLFAKHRFRKVPWGLPGGIIERLEGPQDALVREMNEELNWATHPSQWMLFEVAASTRFPQIEICYVFADRVNPEIFQSGDFSREILELAWVSPSESPAGFYPLARHRRLALLAAERYGK